MARHYKLLKSSSAVTPVFTMILALLALKFCFRLEIVKAEIGGASAPQKSTIKKGQDKNATEKDDRW